MAKDEIDSFRREIIQRTGDVRAAEKLTDQDFLREVMNTVGNRATRESIRCVVSVSMLTEGWDANTVTHVLGVRAFGTQLLCEQVIGRALRRQSYDLMKTAIKVSLASNTPIFLAFRSTSPQSRSRSASTAARDDSSQSGTTRAGHLEITFPRVVGYRVELPRGTIDCQLQRRFNSGTDSGLGRCNRLRAIPE